MELLYIISNFEDNDGDGILYDVKGIWKWIRKIN